MKAWLPILVEKLPEGPILAMSTVRNMARAAVYDRGGAASWPGGWVPPYWPPRPPERPD